MIWRCDLCTPGCELKGSSDPEDPPQGCPWHHNNPDDPNTATWRAVDTAEVITESRPAGWRPYHDTLPRV